MVQVSELSNLKVSELKQICRENKIKGFSKLRKNALIKKILDSNLDINFINLNKINKQNVNKNKQKNKINKQNVNKNKQKNKINKQKVDIKPEDIDYFLKKSTRNNNDRINKIREKIIEQIFNNKNFYNDVFKYTEYSKKYINIAVSLKKLIYTYNNYNIYPTIKLKAGRSHNFDFLAIYKDKKNKIIDSVKIEFKYGCNDIKDYPQFYSKDVKGASIFKKIDFIKYFYENLDNFIKEFDEDTQIRLINNKPTYRQYVSIINKIDYKNPFQKIIYNYDKLNGDKKNLPHKKFCIQNISNFLNNITKEDINFKEWREEIIQKQKDKVFLFCNNGIFNISKINDKIIISDNENIKIKNGNTIVFKCTDNNYSLECLLRWKNHYGCALPAWQVKLKKNN